MTHPCLKLVKVDELEQKVHCLFVFRFVCLHVILEAAVELHDLIFLASFFKFGFDNLFRDFEKLLVDLLVLVLVLLHVLVEHITVTLEELRVGPNELRVGHQLTDLFKYLQVRILAT